MHRGRVIRPVCGGDFAPNVLVYKTLAKEATLQFLFKQQQFRAHVPDWDRGKFTVRYEPISKPPKYEPIADGIAYLYVGDSGRLTAEFDDWVGVPEIGDKLFSLNHEVASDGLDVIVLAPKDYVHIQCSPQPVAAKVTEDGRIGVGWSLAGGPSRMENIRFGFRKLGPGEDPRTVMQQLLSPPAQSGTVRELSIKTAEGSAH